MFFSNVHEIYYDLWRLWSVTQRSGAALFTWEAIVALLLVIGKYSILKQPTSNYMDWFVFDIEVIVIIIANTITFCALIISKFNEIFTRSILTRPDINYIIIAKQDSKIFLTFGFLWLTIQTDEGKLISE